MLLSLKTIKVEFILYIQCMDQTWVDELVLE